MAASVVIGCIGAHAGSCDSVFAKANPCRNPSLLEGPILFVHVELIGLRVVGDQDIWPPVTVRIEDGDAKTFRGRIVQSSFLRGIFKPSRP